VNRDTKQETCIHYWVIDSSHHGVCKHCGAERDFPTWETLMQEEYRRAKAASVRSQAGKESSS